MTKEAIRQAALKRFAKQGYDATSMTEIAGDISVKAPAIYAHFKGKTELYIELVHGVLMKELSHIRYFLNKDGEATGVLLHFLQDMGPRFETTPHLRFLLNVYYLPPPKMTALLVPVLEEYNANREIIINDVFKRLPPCRVPPGQLAAAYLGIIDSIQAEILYGGMDKFKKRLEALWQLFRLAFEQ